MLHKTHTEQYVKNIREWKRIEIQKVKERVRVKIRAMVDMVTDNLGLGLEVRGMNMLKIGDNFMVGNMVALMVKETITIRG